MKTIKNFKFFLNENFTNIITAYYNEYGYEIRDASNSLLFESGNNCYNNATSETVPLDHPNCIPLEKIKQTAQINGAEIAGDRNAEFAGTEYRENIN